jgi:predicted nucleic acid-binding Zn finger protein
VKGTVGELPEDSTEIVVNDSGRIIFGRCACPFFEENLLNQGPCEHMLALFRASESSRVES